MCGLVAIISKKKAGLFFKDGVLFEQMIYADALRGFDSTGMYGVNKYGNLDMIKSAKPAPEVIKTKAFDDFKSAIFSKYQFVVGHNRAATKGATTDENAHPFIEGDICLVHNGTLTHHKNLADTEVDSHAICKAINEKGYKKVLPEINGAFALIWYNIKEKKLHIARNTQRPLWIIQTSTADYIASEPLMLSWLVERVHGIKEAPKFFSTELVYTYDLDNVETGYVTEAFPKKVVSSVPVVITKPALQKTSKQQKKLATALNLVGGRGGRSTELVPFQPGDKIFFEYQRSVIQGNSIKLEGYSSQHGGYEVSGYIEVAKYTAHELEEILESVTHFTGEFVGFSRKRSGKFHLFVMAIKPQKEYISINGHVVTDADLTEAGYCCHECGTILDAEAEDGAFWLRMNNSGGVKSIMCNTCLSEHPHLSQLLTKESTCEESSSTATNLDQQVPNILHLH